MDGDQGLRNIGRNGMIRTFWFTWEERDSRGRNRKNLKIEGTRCMQFGCNARGLRPIRGSQLYAISTWLDRIVRTFRE